MRSTVCLAITLAICVGEKIPSVGIIGGGLGGSSAAYFIKDLFEAGVTIDVYEESVVGGRLATVEINGRIYESGGTVIHSSNLYMKRFTKLFGLKQRKPGAVETMALSDGKDIVFSMSSSIWNYAKLFWRYGWSPLTTERLVDQFIKYFSKIYDYQDKGVAYESVAELLTAMDVTLFNATQQSIKTALLKAGVNEKYIDEIVMATLRVNYGQSVNVQSFAGMVSVAGASAGLWSVEGGNKAIPENLLEKSEAHLVSKRVTKITKLDSQRFQVRSSDVNNNNETEEYDIIIIAVPDIENLLENIPDDITAPYHHTVATLVQGVPVIQQQNIDQLIVLDSKSNINSVAKIFPVDSQEVEEQVWKIFSQTPLSKKHLESMFVSYSSVEATDWKAYPEYDSAQQLGKFKLMRGVYFVNAIEYAASAMEMMVISARNSALLAYYDWTENKMPKSSYPVHQEL